MKHASPRRDEALSSALNRLNVPLIVCDESQVLSPLNARAATLFEAESLRGDLLTSRPSHPLSRFVETVLRSESTGRSARTLVTFPSGRTYAVESSGRSQKGVRRWLILVVEPVAELSVDERSALERFPLTEREFDVARLMMRGLSNEKIAQDMGISPETVKTHVRSIFEKSGTHSRTEFLAAVLRTK
jgi:DNA-binding CsgD family transcriptional regulator